MSGIMTSKFTFFFLPGMVETVVKMMRLKDKLDEIIQANITGQLWSMSAKELWLASISDEDSLSEIALSGASKLASTYFTLFYRSVHVLYTGIVNMCPANIQAEPRISGGGESPVLDSH